MSANNPEFRPPAEADSLVLQVDIGCPHNTCAFCGMYKHLQHRRRNREEITALIARACKRHPDTTRVFLADGDPLSLPPDDFEAILHELNRRLPHLRRINTYANGTAIAAVPANRWAGWRDLKLHTLYMGLESGDDVTLRDMGKQDDVETMVRAALNAQKHGIKMSVMVLLGLAGAARSAIHAAATAQALNRMQPRLLSVLRAIPVPGTEWWHRIRSGICRPLTEYEAVSELRELLQQLELTGTVFRANHSSNILPLEGRLPHDRATLIGAVTDLLDSGQLDHNSPGSMPLWL